MLIFFIAGKCRFQVVLLKNSAVKMDSKNGIISGYSTDMFIQDTLERCHGAAVGTCDAGVRFGIAENAADHFMGYGVGEENNQIRRTDILQSAGHFRIYLCFTFILSAQLLVLSGHAFIAAYDHYAHGSSPFVCS